MNCCADNGRCTCSTGTPRSCDELGLCQRRKPRCEGCIEGLQLTTEGIRFAPGAVEGYRAPVFGSPAQRRELMRWLKPALAFTTVVGLCGLAAGVIAGRYFP